MNAAGHVTAWDVLIGFVLLVVGIILTGLAYRALGGLGAGIAVVLMLIALGKLMEGPRS